MDIQTKYHMYNNEEYLNEILDKGAKKAKFVARKTLKRATTALGLM